MPTQASLTVFFQCFSLTTSMHAKSAIFFSVNDMESAEFCKSAGAFHHPSINHIVAKGIIIITGAGADTEAGNTDARNKQATFQNRAPSKSRYCDGNT